MTLFNNLKGYNPRDYYLLVSKEKGKVYERFRNKGTAIEFLRKHLLKDDLEIIINPKYKNDKK